MAAASVLWLPYQALSFLVRSGATPQPGNSPLGEASLLLLLTLLHHSPQPPAPSNPFRLALNLLQVCPGPAGYMNLAQAQPFRQSSVMLSSSPRKPAHLCLPPLEHSPAKTLKRSAPVPAVACLVHPTST